MQTAPQRAPSRSIVLLVAVMCLLVVAFDAWRLPGAWHAWHAWRAGTRDTYPGQHQSLFLGTVRGIALGMVIPIPVLVTRIAAEPRWRRRALWGAWVLLMATVILTFALEVRAWSVAA